MKRVAGASAHTRSRPPAGSFLVTAHSVYRQQEGRLEPWDRADCVEALTEWLENAGMAYVLEEESRDRIWVHCW